MSNMMPGDNSGAEWDDHKEDCKTNCSYPLTRDDDGEGNENWQCAVGHWDHECNCADIHASDLADFYESQAEAYIDRGWDR